MSRVEFRAVVDAPRPAAAWVMVGVAGASLWITGQLAPWAVAIQAAALIGSLRLRRRPHPWQRSPIALNAGMFAVVGATIHVALRGEPSTVALAHFAALVQGLQLIDVRPRRSEFLLVAMALFQVTLAANLTDSILFIVLLAAFLVATTWTLIVHTLRCEALEAGNPGALRRVITPGLLRTAVFGSAVAFALGLALFVLLPRMRSTLVEGVPLGGTFAAAGFSDRVELGDLGRIRQDPSVMMRVETLGGESPKAGDAYWRGLAFDRFDGLSWSITPPVRSRVPGVAEIGVALGGPSGDPELVQRIVREPVSAGVIFSAGAPWRFQGTVRRLERDVNGGTYAPRLAEQRIRYTVVSSTPSWKEAALRRDLAQPPARDGARYLQLQPLDPAIHDLAGRITSDSRSDAERARAIESYLRRTGRYSDTPPPLDPQGHRSPVETFLLGETSGHCEYFATAMVVLARSLGLPARLVNGFAGGRRNRIGGFVEVTRSDAHAWVEVHYAGAGWVRYDPTPPDLRLRGEAGASMLARLSELGSALELWWFQRVVGFDRSDQLRAMKAAWLAWRGRRGAHAGLGDADRARSGEWRDWRSWELGGVASLRGALAVGGALCALALAVRIVRRARRSQPLPPAYARALQLLAQRGLTRGSSVTARDFARRVRATLPPQAGAAFDSLTECYLAERFGARPSPAAASELERMREGLLESKPAQGAP